MKTRGEHDVATRIVDLRAVAEALREETVFTFATITFARRILRGRKVPRDLRRALRNAEQAAQTARERARSLDEMMIAAGDVTGRP